METSKRLTNSTCLKFKFIPATNDTGSKYKITQTNFNKSIYITDLMDLETTDFINYVLDRAEQVENYSLIVDNTQNSAYLYNVNFKANSFENILNNFKIK